MMKEAIKIADSLRACNDLQCKRCKHKFGMGCAVKLKNEAADMLERFAAGKSDNVDAFEPAAERREGKQL